MRTSVLTLAFIMILGILNAQQTVTFETADGLTVTADNYVVGVDYPYILLLHQAGYSRGEYRHIAPKLTNMGYNCLAIDQRSGNEMNGVKNATAQLAKSKNLPTNYIDALPDIIAAIAYIKTQNSKPIIIWGSSYSASLALVVAASELRVGGVVSFSPGEYFDDKNYVRSNTSKISVPVFATSAKSECDQTRLACSSIKPELITIFCPSQEGVHGSSALMRSNPSNDDYWLALSMFFSKLE